MDGVRTVQAIIDGTGAARVRGLPDALRLPEPQPDRPGGQGRRGAARRREPEGAARRCPATRWQRSWRRWPSPALMARRTAPFAVTGLRAVLDAGVEHRSGRGHAVATRSARPGDRGLAGDVRAPAPALEELVEAGLVDRATSTTPSAARSTTSRLRPATCSGAVDDAGRERPRTLDVDRRTAAGAATARATMDRVRLGEPRRPRVALAGGDRRQLRRGAPRPPGPRAGGGRAGAVRRAATTVVLTFDPHPVRVVAPGRAPRHPHDPRPEGGARRGRSASTGSWCFPSTPRWRRSAGGVRPPGARRALEPRHVVVGESFRFGRGRDGDVATLAELGRSSASRSRRLRARAPRRAPDQQQPRARGASAGAVAEARAPARAAVLRRRSGAAGSGRGRTLGFPTANLELGERDAARRSGCTPPGAACRAAGWRAGGRQRRASDRPSGGARSTVEAHLLDFDGDLYGAGRPARVPRPAAGRAALLRPAGPGRRRSARTSAGPGSSFGPRGRIVRGRAAAQPAMSELPVDTRELEGDRAALPERLRQRPHRRASSRARSRRPSTESRYRLVVNCAELTYIASAGLGALMGVIEEIRHERGRHPARRAQRDGDATSSRSSASTTCIASSRPRWRRSSASARRGRAAVRPRERHARSRRRWSSRSRAAPSSWRGPRRHPAAGGGGGLRRGRGRAAGPRRRRGVDQRDRARVPRAPGTDRWSCASRTGARTSGSRWWTTGSRSTRRPCRRWTSSATPARVERAGSACT